MSDRIRSPGRTALATLLVVLASACDAFPETLRAKILDGGSVEEAGPGGGGRVAPAPAREAVLLTVDSGQHRSFSVIAGSGGPDIVVWSSDAGATSGYRVRYCSSNDCSTPKDLATKVCDRDGVPFTGYFAGAGSKILATNLKCTGYVCAFDPARGSEEVSCAFGPSFRRLFGDTTGIFATSGARGADGPPEVEIHSFDPALVVGNLPDHPSIVVPNLANTGLSDIAVSPTKVHWAESVDGSASFRVVACPRALSPCGEPREILKPRAGVAVALTATDAEVFVAVATAGESEIVRVAASGEATTLARGGDAVGGLAVAGDFVYWSEGSSVLRCPRAGACSSETIGHVPRAISHLAVTADGARLYVLSAAGVHRL